MKYFFSIVFFTIFFNCEKSENVFSVKGSVQSKNTDNNMITVSHDTIKGLMPPMIMPFTVRDTNDISMINIGDSVHFRFVWDDEKPYATNFKIIGKGTVLENDEFFADEYSEKLFNQKIDDVTLLNLDSNKVSLSHSDGKFRFISFIFSRCPMPNMCPAIMMKNSVLASNFSEVEFIVVSFDYKYDIPSRLFQVYGSLIENLQNLKVWSSVGCIDDVYKLTRQSGGNFWGVEKGKIGHTMSSVLIGKERNVLGTFKGEDWTIDEAKNVINLYLKK